MSPPSPAPGEGTVGPHDTRHRDSDPSESEGLDQARVESFGRYLESIRHQPVGDRQAAARAVGEAIRKAVDELHGTSAPTAVLAEAAAKMAEVVTLLEGYGGHRSAEGFAEGSGGAHDPAFFEWSPVLGFANPLASAMRLEVQGDAVVAWARFGAAYEGPPGCVHGGVLAAAFDDVLGLTQSLSGQVGMTGTLSVRYRRPTPLHADLRFEGRLDKVSGRKVSTSGRLISGEELTAEATGLFVTVPPERFARLSGRPPG